MLRSRFTRAAIEDFMPHLNAGQVVMQAKKRQVRKRKSKVYISLAGNTHLCHTCKIPSRLCAARMVPQCSSFFLPSSLFDTPTKGPAAGAGAEITGSGWLCASSSAPEYRVASLMTAFASWSTITRGRSLPFQRRGRIFFRTSRNASFPRFEDPPRRYDGLLNEIAESVLLTGVRARRDHDDISGRSKRRSAPSEAIRC